MAAASGSRVTGMVARTFYVESSGGGAAAVDGVGGAGNVARFVGGEERHDGGDLGRLSEPARRNPVDDLVVRRRLIAGIAALQDRAQHPAVDQAGADAIDPHAGAGALPGRTLG